MYVLQVKCSVQAGSWPLLMVLMGSEGLMIPATKERLVLLSMSQTDPSPLEKDQIYTLPSPLLHCEET